MDKCLICNKPLNDEKLYHHSCIKNLFNSDSVPSFEFDPKDDKNVSTLLDKKTSITGVQKKLSFGLSKDKTKLTFVDKSYTYILKPETEEFPEIARAEQLVMSLADLIGIKTAPHGLLKGKDNKYVYITKRFDRDKENKIHCEDMCQLSNKTTEYKYDGSYEYVGKLIANYTHQNLAEVMEYFYRLLFCFVSCNSDMHLKNFTLIEDENIYLSPAYDLLPVNIIYPNDKEQTALTLNGKKKNLTRNDFLKLGHSLSLNEKAILRLMSKIYSYKDVFIKEINDSLLEKNTKERFIKELNKRIEIFK